MKKSMISLLVLFFLLSGASSFLSSDMEANAFTQSGYKKPHSYDELVGWYQQLEKKYPNYIEVFKANEMYGVEKVDGEYDVYYVRITNESLGFHKPEVLFLGSPHGDETVGTICMYWFVDWLMRYAFEKESVKTKWLRWILDNREIYLEVSHNPYGFDLCQRSDSHGWDLNREADYDGPGRYGPPECWSSATGKTLREFINHHLIRIGTDFHGGARMLLYPWSSTHEDVKAKSPISGKEYSYAPPDFYFYDAASLRCGSYMGNFGGNLNAKNIGPIAATIGYEAPGCIAAWAYGANVERNPAEDGYVEDEIFGNYPGAGIFWISPEISVIKDPPEWELGSDLIPGYGMEVRNFLLHQIDLAQPYLQWISPPHIAYPGEKIKLKWQVNGSLVVDHTSIQWGTNEDVINNPEWHGKDHDDYAGKYIGGTGWDNARNGHTYGKIWEEEIEIPHDATDIYVVAKAQVDQIYKETIAPSIYGNNHSYLRIIQERTNESFVEIINGTDGEERIEGRIWWFSPILHIPIGGIKKPKNGFLYISNREIIPTYGKAIIIGKITIEVECMNTSKVEFYIDDELKYVDKEEPYQWTWDEMVVGNHVIKVVILNEKIREDGREVFIINLGS
ncbi:MAG: zinc carboxypeptidase [Thermoplasmata archaeon]|nr:MAG: zinc carboxypeptidase [Thermoplasmata archaeon]